MYSTGTGYAACAVLAALFLLNPHDPPPRQLLLVALPREPTSIDSFSSSPLSDASTTNRLRPPPVDRPRDLQRECHPPPHRCPCSKPCSKPSAPTHFVKTIAGSSCEFIPSSCLLRLLGGAHSHAPSRGKVRRCGAWTAQDRSKGGALGIFARTCRPHPGARRGDSSNRRRARAARGL